MPTESEYERFVEKLKKTKSRKPNKPKIIKKDLLMQVRLAYIKYHNIKGNDIVEEDCYNEWVSACKKAFPIDPHYAPHKYNLLKDLSRDLRREPFETWCKVYAALGYIVE